MLVPTRLLGMWRPWSSEKAWILTSNLPGFAVLRREPVTPWCNARALDESPRWGLPWAAWQGNLGLVSADSLVSVSSSVK